MSILDKRKVNVNLKKLDIEEQIKPKASRRGGNVRKRINKTETIQKIEKVNKAKNSYLKN